MKTYLVPTDYSEVANNATLYAIELAKKESAKIVLFHVFQIPYPTTHDSYVPMISIDELEKDSMIELQKHRDTFLEQSANMVQIECYTMAGFVSEGIESYLQHNHADLIVMGITGGSKMKEVFIGSNATSVVRNCKKNVLIIPADARYKEISKIGFATDFLLENEESAEQQIKHYADLFKAQVVAINISSNDDLNTPEKTGHIQRVKSHFGGYDFEVETLEGEDVSVEIEHYVAEHHCDWLAIVPKHHNVFENMFNKTITKKLAYHLHVPVLAIYEQK